MIGANEEEYKMDAKGLEVVQKLFSGEARANRLAYIMANAQVAVDVKKGSQLYNDEQI
jgi:hypothetical protein